MASLSVCLFRICTHTCDVCTLTGLNSLLSSIATWPACLFVSSVYVLTRVTSVHSQFSTHYCLVLQHGQLVCLSLPYMYSHVDVCTLTVLNSLLSSIATWPACPFVSSVYVLTRWRTDTKLDTIIHRGRGIFRWTWSFHRRENLGLY